MGGRGRGGNSRKVKRFKSSWLDESVDGTKVRLWCRPDPSNPQRAQCLLCPDTSFNIGEGFTAIRAHSNRKKHQDQLKASQTDPEFQPPKQQMNMEEGLRKMEEARQEDARRFEEALVAETKMVAAYMFHGCSGPLFDCGAELFPKIFKKCEVTKKWKLRRTKASYIAVHGLAPWFKGRIIQAMQLRPYSCNFDESTVNGKSQVALSVAYLTSELLVERRCLAVIEVKEGTSGQEMANLVLEELQTNNIPIQQMMSVKTDGCSAMLGALQGAQKYLRDKVATLPTFGGCIDHNLANLLKSAVKSLNKDLVSIYPAMHACIAKHSMHKKRDF